MEKEQFKQYLFSFIKLLSLYLNKKEDSSFIIDKSHLSFFYKMAKLHSLRAILYLAIKVNKVQVEDGVRRWIGSVTQASDCSCKTGKLPFRIRFNIDCDEGPESVRVTETPRSVFVTAFRHGS